MLTSDAIQLFIHSRQAKGLSKQTVRWYEGILYSFAKHYPELPESPEAIECFIANCTAGDERRHGYFRAVRAFYRFLKRRHQLQNPVELIDTPKRKPKLPKSLMPDELDQLLAFPHKPKIKAALLTLTDTGARTSEIAEIKIQDIEETPWGYTLRISGKTGTRIVPINHETYQALTKVLPFGFTAYRFRRLISQAFKDANVKGSGIWLRHTFGTLWEGDELVLQQIMGHAHLSTTKIYRHLRMQTLCTQHRKYSPLSMVLPRSKIML